MNGVELRQYTEEPSDYLICFNPDNHTDISCVIVEDDPGPYLDFIQDIVHSGTCRLAMTAPFADRTINFLRGQPVIWGEGHERITLALDNPAHCVLILDMRNGISSSTVQSFAGYDVQRFDLAGYQFFKQLRGFPGKPFIATRYGRDLLEEQGITGAFGIVTLGLKSDYHGPMQESDKRKLLAALDLVMIQCDVSAIYSMSPCGDHMQITFAGEITSIGISKPALAFMEVVRAGNDGLTDDELAEHIEYTSRERRPQPPCAESEIGHAVSGTKVEDLLQKLIHLVRNGQIKGVEYANFLERLGDDPERLEINEEEILRKAFLLCQEKDADLTTEGFIRLLCNAPASSEQAERPTDWESMSAFGQNGPPEIISADDKWQYIKNYRELHYKEIPRLQIKIKYAQMERLKMEAEGLTAVAESAEASNLPEAHARKKTVGRLDAEHQKQIKELVNQVIQIGRLRDEYYRIGFKSTPVKNTEGKTTGFCVAVPTTKVGDAMRHHKPRLIKSLKRCTSVPHSLIDHIERHWGHENGVHRYTGGLDWQIYIS